MRIEAYTDDGTVVHRFATLREAGRAGFTLSRLHVAVKTGERHKGFRWRQVDGLHSLQWFLKAAQSGIPREVPGREIYDAFLASLPEPERDISYEDFMREARRWIDNVFQHDICFIRFGVQG